jgi:hypothetical protein
MDLNEQDFQERLRSAISGAFNRNLMTLPSDNDAVTSNVIAKKQAMDMAEEEVEEEKGYSPFLKSDENPKGETEGLTVDVLNQILMKIVQDEEGEGGETTEATGAGSAGGFEAPLFTEPKKNHLFQPGTESKLTTKPEGGFVNEQEDVSDEDGQEEVDTNDYDFMKGEYEADTKSYVGSYLVGEETPKQLEVYNIRQYPDNDAFFISGHKPYSMSLHKAMLPVSQIEILGDVPGKDGFKFIRMPYWFYKKNMEDLKIQRVGDQRALYMKGWHRKPQQLEKLFDPMFEKYFEHIVYDELDQTKYDITKMNHKKFNGQLNESRLKDFEKQELVRKLMKAAQGPGALKHIEMIIDQLQRKLDDTKASGVKYVRGVRVDEERIKGGKADGMDIEDIAKMHDITVDDIYDEFTKGIQHEMEHTSEMMVAVEIVLDHLYEDPEYYTKLEGMESGGEATEATTSASAGVYDAPFGGPKKDPLKLSNPDTVEKELISTKSGFPKYGGPGAKYVKIKSKCKKFPYCNQGDINALEFFEREVVKEIVSNTAEKANVEEYVVRNIIAKELGYIKEQEDGEEHFATFELPDDYKSKSAEENQKEWLDSIPDERAKFLIKELKDKEIEFNANNGLSGKVKIIDAGPKGKIGGFFGQASEYDFGDSNYAELWVEMSDLKFKGQSVPVEFYDMISRYLPPEEEEDSYRGNPVENAIILGMDYVKRVMKSLGLHLISIRINPYARFR